jgi:hypothetical protein
MKVFGRTIPQSTIDACVARMRGGPFSVHDIDGIARERNIAPWYFARSTSDRLIQRERKAGHIKYDGVRWTWVGD